MISSPIWAVIGASFDAWKTELLVVGNRGHDGCVGALADRSASTAFITLPA
ncbi:MAG TPA: hypothetical protein VE196_04405 [Pseudonocardiaceae bacterium]|nr:hypothetical protein [Pseudonocardiaceae bacterium]